MKCLALFALAITLNSVMSNSIGTKADKKVMVCYYGSWAVYRPGAGKFDVEDIDPFVCTHIIYGFAGLGPDNTIVSLDSWNDLYDNYGKGAFERFTGLKNQNPELKALLAIGGWNEGSIKYSQMVANPASRAKFTASVVDFLLQFGFDGFDFDWEYPADRGGVPADKVNFISMISELKTAFAPHGLMLTAAVSPGKNTIDAAYDIPAMSNILDHIHIMGYDYHGAWDPFTGHNSPLFVNPDVDQGTDVWFNMDYTVNYFIDNGAPPSKLVLGMPLYGRGFTLNNPSDNGFYAPANQPLIAGPYTREAGIWGYNEICEKGVETSWTVVRDSYYQAPYAYQGNQWIGFDDVTSLKNKAQYVTSKNLLGAMVWSIETDDFHGTCSGTKFILIKSIYESMNGPIVTPTPGTGTPSTSTPRTTLPTGTTNTRASTPAGTGPTSAPGTCTAPGFYPELDCGHFYECVPTGSGGAGGGFTIVHYECAPGTAFNPAIKACDWPYNVPGCENYVGK